MEQPKYRLVIQYHNFEHQIWRQCEHHFTEWNKDNILEQTSLLVRTLKSDLRQRHPELKLRNDEFFANVIDMEMGSEANQALISVLADKYGKLHEFAL